MLIVKVNHHEENGVTLILPYFQYILAFLLSYVPAAFVKAVETETPENLEDNLAFEKPEER